MEDTKAPPDIDIVQDESTGCYRARYEWTNSEPLSTVIVRLVAEIADTEPLELEPLCERIDPDALDELFEPTHDRRSRSMGQVTFPFADYRVVVSGTGEIEIYPD